MASFHPYLWLTMGVKRVLPRGLLGRSLLIIVVPLILVQVVATVVFYERHWGTVTRRLAQNLAGDIVTIVEHMRAYPSAGDRSWLFNLVDDSMGLTLTFEEGGVFPNIPLASSRTLFEDDLEEALTSQLQRPFLIDTSQERWVEVRVQVQDGVLHIFAPIKRLASSTTYIFLIWMAGTALLVSSIAIIFMRNQVKSVRRLAAAADALGKGHDVPYLKPEGAAEVRLAAIAFARMRDRIKSLLGHRTEMLAGVSHDLRTPLTRMKLQLAMMGDADGVTDLKADLDEMGRMIEGYLAFARGEGGELPVKVELARLLDEVVGGFKRQGTAIDLHIEGDMALMLRPDAVRRCLNNLIGNATRYAGHIWVRAGLRDAGVEILIDDDGPGIPAEMREEVFRPFYRIESSRNKKTGGVGLGLTIARDIVRSHGGDIRLEDNPSGGLRVRITLPL
ncbi:putative two-component sensor histidine kinase [Rhodospirillaceae bacterium LM-1]|nr:putative two-component sensor histidine kinase [Rhodospirillaceae bacterium LM-1]